MNNTYVDDIFDSVGNATEAESLITAVDKVPAAGGFKVKEWISNASKNDQDPQPVTPGCKEEPDKVFE